MDKKCIHEWSWKSEVDKHFDYRTAICMECGKEKGRASFKRDLRNLFRRIFVWL